MLIHDIIKIKYVQLGYIKKNYPYHLISDEEMFNAFIQVDEDFESPLIDPDVRFFDINYPNPFTDSPEDAEYYNAYGLLKQSIIVHIQNYLQYYGTATPYELPNWVYTYMLGEVISDKSDYQDIEDLLDLLEQSNIDNEFTRATYIACYRISTNYIISSKETREPTIFGEPHVIKSLRLEV